MILQEKAKIATERLMDSDIIRPKDAEWVHTIILDVLMNGGSWQLLETNNGIQAKTIVRNYEDDYDDLK